MSLNFDIAPGQEIIRNEFWTHAYILMESLTQEEYKAICALICDFELHTNENLLSTCIEHPSVFDMLRTFAQIGIIEASHKAAQREKEIKELENE